jgi:hypothetical protein
MALAKDKAKLAVAAVKGEETQVRRDAVGQRAYTGCTHALSACSRLAACYYRQVSLCWFDFNNKYTIGMLSCICTQLCHQQSVVLLPGFLCLVP